MGLFDFDLSDLDPTNPDSALMEGFAEIDPTNPNSTLGQQLQELAINSKVGNL